MVAQCGTLGPACIAYLESIYNSTSLAAAVKKFGAVAREPIIGPDQIAGIVAVNKRYARLQFTDEQLVALILLKLPDKYSLDGHDLDPTVGQPAGDHGAHQHAPDRVRVLVAGRPRRLLRHRRPARPPHILLQLRHAGPHALGLHHAQGHLQQVRRPRAHDQALLRAQRQETLPAGMDAAKKQRIADKRVAYKASRATCLTTVECAADVEAQIREDEDFVSAMQRLGL